MTEQDLRALIRQAVLTALASRGMAGSCAPHATAAADAPVAGHPSHATYLTIVNSGEACVIEPAVACNHCNYCRSHGH